MGRVLLGHCLSVEAKKLEHLEAMHLAHGFLRTISGMRIFRIPGFYVNSCHET